MKIFNFFAKRIETIFLFAEEKMKNMSNLIRWNPFWDRFDEMDKIFSELVPMAPRAAARNGFMPAIDMYEDDENVIVETQLAGVDPEKVDVSIENDVLTIRGEGEKKSEVEDKNYYRKEIHRGSFYRSIPLPTHVVGEKASATAEDGVLKISVPKAPEAKPKKIEIKTK